MKHRYAIALITLFMLLSFTMNVLAQSSAVATEPEPTDSGEHQILQENVAAEEHRSSVQKEPIEGIYEGVSDEIRALLGDLDWQTNTDYQGLGSPDAKKGGTLKSAESAYPPSLRTVGKNANSVFNSMLSGLCYESMLDLDPITFDYVPNLARRWAIADDKVTFFFEMDESARWSDGNPVVAEDVVLSWKLYIDPGIEDPFDRLLEQI